MTYPSLADPFDAVRRTLDRATGQLIDQAISAVQAAALRGARNRIRTLNENIEYVTTVLGRLPHGIANVVADSFRGPLARPLTSGERTLVERAFAAQPVHPNQVRIVLGAGNQPLAASAFLNKNPAICIGNTIYLNPFFYKGMGGNDLSFTPTGVDMLLHEYTHVIQYARLGFAAFGKRYAQEFLANGGNADKMYDHNSRNLHYDDELIEGQAAIVGHLGRQMKLPLSQRDPVLIHQLRTKLRGTGILGQ